MYPDLLILVGPLRFHQSSRRYPDFANPGVTTHVTSHQGDTQILLILVGPPRFHQSSGRYPDFTNPDGATQISTIIRGVPRFHHRKSKSLHHTTPPSIPSDNFRKGV